MEPFKKRAVQELSIKIINKFINRRDGMYLLGACYRVAILINVILEKEYNILSKVVVGYINDGTDDIFISHAWLEVDNKK